MLLGQLNQAALDWPWSFVHTLSGIAIGWILANTVRWRPTRTFWVSGIGLLVLWELVEVVLRLLDQHAHQAIAPLKHAVHSFAFAQESLTNSLGDLVVGTLGLWIGRQLTGRRRT